MLVGFSSYEIWSEGYLCTGMEGIPAKAHLHGNAWGTSFEDACVRFYAGDKYFDPDRLTYCRNLL